VRDTTIGDKDKKSEMAVNQSEISVLPPFDCKTDTCTIGTRLRRWKRPFDYFLLAKGMTAPAQQKALLLHTAVLMYRTFPICCRKRLERRINSRPVAV